MNEIKKISLALLTVLATSNAFAECGANVDNIESFYINGMFTDYSDYTSNKNALKNFLVAYLESEGFNPNIQGQHNKDENKLSQIFEVARQKWEDDDAADEIIKFLNNESSSSERAKEAIAEFLQDISIEYQSTISEEDSQLAIAKLENILDSCSRVVLISHSQGNFYGNAILNDLYSSYNFPNGYALSDYPMLGTMQIATPVDIPGGTLSTLYPDLIGHVTNEHDVIMQLVRELFGAAPSNFNGPENPIDETGHSLEDSYLIPQEQALEISNQMKKVAYSLTPYPMIEQWSANSSALSAFGYSSISSLLDIEFHDGSIYRYSGVTPNIFTGFINASSQGGYFNSNIRNNYATSQIE
ncbi:KTSC domain-containing protein [Colwellia sp. E150_009]|jgi:hypothetical protein